MTRMPEDPIIRNMEETGFPDRKEPPPPVCPVCGKQCDTFYTSSFWGEIVGCDRCITSDDAYTDD